MNDSPLIRVLPGIHISPETAYVVEDYPFGFKLRCRMRCWLEVDPKKGVRYCTQTTNPRKGNAVWNAVKKSTYARMAGAMYLDEKDHIHWNGLSEYSDAQKAQEFKEVYGEGVPEAIKPTMEKWIKTKVRYEELIAQGVNWQEAGRQVSLEAVTGKLD